MGKIDLLALKRQKQEKESHVMENVPDELQQSYTSVWGKNRETVEYIEPKRLSVFCDKKGREQPFKINLEKVEQIKASAADVGIITPLIVRKYEGNYQIIAGHHRLEAAKQLNLLTVPCVVRDIADDDMLKIAAESNIQRMKMLPSEYGELFTRYLEIRHDIDISVNEIAEKFGVAKKTMYRYVNVAKLISGLQELVDSNMINIDTVDILCTFSEENQESVCEYVQNQEKRLTIGTAKKMAEIVLDNQNEKVSPEQFDCLNEPKQKKVYKNKVYNTVAEKYNIEYSEKELDSIVEKLLKEYFDSRR